MTYSRENPSARYRELLAMYRQMHEQGEKFLGHPAAETFDGRSLPPQVKRIKRLIERTGSTRILDYGSGKGRQYDPRPLTIGGRVWADVIDYWGVDEVRCFDPGYEPYSQLPEDRFDGVVCTDVLEHCPEEDIPWIVKEMFSFADRFVFATIACYPARKRLPNGENAHITVRDPDWWARQFSSATGSSRIEWEAWVEHAATNGSKQLVQRRLSNFPNTGTPS